MRTLFVLLAVIVRVQADSAAQRIGWSNTCKSVFPQHFLFAWLPIARRPTRPAQAYVTVAWMVARPLTFLAMATFKGWRDRWVTPVVASTGLVVFFLFCYGASVIAPSKAGWPLDESPPPLPQLSMCISPFLPLWNAGF